MLWPLLFFAINQETNKKRISWKEMGVRLDPSSLISLPLLLLCSLMFGFLPRGTLTFVTLAPPTGIRPPPQSWPACKASELRALTFPYILDLPACRRLVFLNLLWFQYRCCPDITIRNNVVGARNKCGPRILLDRCKVDDGKVRWVPLTNDFLFTAEKVMPVWWLLEDCTSQTHVNICSSSNFS